MSPVTSSKPIIALVIETGCTLLWGRVHYADNLIVEEASTAEVGEVRAYLLECLRRKPLCPAFIYNKMSNFLAIDLILSLP